MTEALICEDSCHHGATPFNSREFGSDNCRQWVIATDARSEHKAPKDHCAEDGQGWARTCDCERKSCEDDNHELDTIHLLSTMNNLGIYLLTTDVICQETETELSEDIATWGGDFERGIEGRRQCSGSRVDISNHDVCEVNREEIVGVSVTTVNIVAPWQDTIQHRRR